MIAENSGNLLGLLKVMLNSTVLFSLPRDANAERGYEIAFVCPSVRLWRSGIMIDNIGWSASKIISRPKSLRSMRSSNIGDLVQREHPQN